MTPLEGFTVVDVSDHLSGQACGQVLRQAGARSVLVEPPSGVRSRTWSSDQPAGQPGRHAETPTYLYRHLNADKTTMVVDPDDPVATDQLHDLLQTADVVITSASSSHLVGDLPATAVECRVSDFPEDSPLSRWRGSEILHQALSGTMYVTGNEHERPLFGAGQRAYWAGGLTASIAVLTALVEREGSGRGQRVAMNVFEACAAMAQNLVTQFSYNGTFPTRKAYPGMLSVIRCEDAWVVLFAFGHWEGVCKAFGVPELATDPRFATVEERMRRWTEITELLQSGASTIPADQVVAVAQANRICAEKVATIGDVLTSGYFRAEGSTPRIGGWLADTAYDGQTSAPHRQVARPSPEATAGPLDGLRVLDLTTAWAGPMATRMLAFLGAEVIKIEAPPRPDLWRAALGRGALDRFPDLSPGERPYNRNALFNTQNHDKLSIGLDLKHAASRPIVDALVARADLVISNFPPGVMERLGLGYDHLRSLNDRVVAVEMPAFRSGSDLAGHVGMGKTMEAASGMGSLIAYGPDTQPVPTGPAYLDPIGGLHGATAALLGYLRVLRTGRGSHLEAAQTDAATRWIGEYLLEHQETGRSPEGRGNDVRGMSPHDSFRCAGDDEWVVIAVDSDEAWALLVEHVDADRLRDPRLGTLAGRQAASAVVRDVLEAWTSRNDKHELAAALQAGGVMAAPVNNGRDVHGDMTLRRRGFVVELNHPEAGVHEYPSVAIHLDRTPGLVRRPAPTFGQDNDAVLGCVLGLSTVQIEMLRQRGALQDEPLHGELS